MPTIDSNNAHHGSAGTLDAGRYVTKPAAENPAGAAALTRSRAAGENARAESRLALEYKLKELYPNAKAAWIEDGRVTEVFLTDAPGRVDYTAAGDTRSDEIAELAQTSVAGLTDDVVTVHLNRTIPASDYTNRVTATVTYQQDDQYGRGDLIDIGSEELDVTDLLAQIPAEELGFNETADLDSDGPDSLEFTDQFHAQYELTDQMVRDAESAGLLSMPTGCAFNVRVDRQQFEAFAQERIARESEGGPADA
jgi:hypothetical protein